MVTAMAGDAGPAPKAPRGLVAGIEPLDIGVRRQSVSEELSELRANGTIEQRRNGIRILDRGRLEGYACECYRETRALYAELVEPLL